MTTKAQLLAANKIKARTVPFPKSGMTLTIRNPRYARKQEILAVLTEKLPPNEDGSPHSKEALAAHELQANLAMQKLVMLECVIDDDGKPLFEEADMPELFEGDGVIIGEVVAEVMGSLAAGKVREAGNVSAQTSNVPSSSV